MQPQRLQPGFPQGPGRHLLSLGLKGPSEWPCPAPLPAGVAISPPGSPSSHCHAFPQEQSPGFLMESKSTLKS